MTVIAAFSILSHPLIIGDILLSDFHTPNVEEINIPTVGNLSKVFEVTYIPIVDLKQKVHIISKNLVIAWSGSCVAAKTVISELSRRSRKEIFTRNSLESFFKEAEEERWFATQEVCFIGYIHDALGIKPFHYSTNTDIDLFHSSELGDVMTGGTGGKDIKDFVNELLNISLTPDEKKNSLHISIEHAVLVTSKFLQNEMTCYNSPENNWGFLFQCYGGGYEIATFINGEFQKVDDILYIFWIAKSSGSGIPSVRPHKLIKYLYMNDILFIRKACINNEEGILFENTVHAIPPVHRILTEEEEISIHSNDELKNTSIFKSKIICHHILIEVDGQHIGGAIGTEIPVAEEERLVSLVAHNNGIVIEVKEDLIAGISSKAETVIKEHLQQENP